GLARVLGPGAGFDGTERSCPGSGHRPRVGVARAGSALAWGYPSTPPGPFPPSERNAPHLSQARSSPPIPATNNLWRPSGGHSGGSVGFPRTSIATAGPVGSVASRLTPGGLRGAC